MSRKSVKKKQKSTTAVSKSRFKTLLKKLGPVVGVVTFGLAIVGLVGVPYLLDNYIHRITVSPNSIGLYGAQFETITTFSISNNSNRMLYSVEVPITLKNCVSDFADFSVEPINPNDKLSVTIGSEEAGLVWAYNYMMLGGITMDGEPYLQLHINSFPPKTTELFQIKFGKGAISKNGEKVTASINISSYSTKATPLVGG